MQHLATSSRPQRSEGAANAALAASAPRIGAHFHTPAPRRAAPACAARPGLMARVISWISASEVKA